MNCGKQRFLFEASFYIRFRESSYVIRQYSKSKLAYESLFRFCDHNRQIQCRFLNISEFYSCEALSSLVFPWFEKAIQVVSGEFEAFISGRRRSSCLDSAEQL